MEKTEKSAFTKTIGQSVRYKQSVLSFPASKSLEFNNDALYKLNV